MGLMPPSPFDCLVSRRKSLLMPRSPDGGLRLNARDSYALEIAVCRIIVFSWPCKIAIIAFWNKNDHTLPGSS